MAAEIDQVKPLAPASAFRFRSDEDEALSVQLRLRKRSYLKCCGCVTAILLIIIVTALVLGFTVFHIKEPQVNMNKIEVQRLEFYPNGTLRTDVNVTLLADVSVKNPNMAPFKFNDGITTVYYRGEMVGEGKTPAGKARARRTFHMNATMDVIPARLLGVESNLMNEVSSTRLMNMTSYTVIRGKALQLYLGPPKEPRLGQPAGYVVQCYGPEITKWPEETVVGEVQIKEGRVESRETENINVRIDVRSGKLSDAKNLSSDMNSGVVKLRGYAEMNGRILLMGVAKKRRMSILNCTMSLNLTSGLVGDLSCN